MLILLYCTLELEADSQPFLYDVFLGEVALAGRSVW